MGQADVEYFIEGHDIREFGVYVSSSSGIVSKLQEKETLSVDWNNCHGECVDRSTIMYKPRTISLGCFIEACSYDDFIGKSRMLFSLLEGPGTKRLKIDVGIKPLVYEVYCKDSIDISKKWDNTHMVGTFTLKLIEPEPVKMVLSGSGDARLSLTTSCRVNIYWGDGSHTYDVLGEKTLSHTYTDGKMHEIIITGVLEGISDISSNYSILWNRLQ